MSQIIKEIVERTMQLHASDCIFTTDATATIIADASRHQDKSAIVDEIERAIRRNELYCPHQGIDRLPRI